MKQSKRKRYSTGKRVSYAQGDPVYEIDDGDKNNGGDDDNGGGDDNGIIDFVFIKPNVNSFAAAK